MTRSGSVMDQAALEAWGRAIGTQLPAPAVLALEGPLGAGKSTLARAVARGAGVEGPLPSPTFNLMFRYPTPNGGSFVHVDLYRLRSPAEVAALGWEELFDDDALVVIEWPQRAGELLPANRWLITLGVTPDQPALRAVEVKAVGAPTPAPVLDPGRP